MKSKFKVGDRVNVYGGIHDIDNKLVENGAKSGTIISISDDTATLGVEFDKPQNLSSRWNVHRKQCRKLKPRAPQYYYINEYTHGGIKNSHIRETLEEAETIGKQLGDYIRTIKLKVVK